MLPWRKAGAAVFASSICAALGWGGLSVGQEMIEQSESLIRVAVRLPERREAARQLGLYPGNVSDTASPVNVADEENAALLYEVIDAQLRAENEGNLPPVGDLAAFLNINRRTEKNRIAVRNILAGSTDLLPSVHAAAARPKCRFTFPPDAEASADDNLVGTQAYLVRLVLADAVCDLEAGRFESALRSLGVSLRIGQHAGERGDYDGLSCRAGAQSVAFSVLAELIREAGEEQLSRFGPQIEALLLDTPIEVAALRLALPPTVRDTLDGLEQWRDRPFPVLEGEFLLDYDPAWRALYELDRRLTRREWTDGMESLALDYFCRAASVLETPSPVTLRDGWTALRDMDRAFREEHTDISRRAMPLRYASLPQTILFAETRRSVARATLRLYTAAQVDKAFPTTLPGAPIPDPFSPTGESLRLTVTPRGRHLLYSVGTNGTDEGGSLRRMFGGTRGPTEDLVFRLDTP